MARSIGWQPLLLIIATLLALGFAAGGWALGRWRSQAGRSVTAAGKNVAQHEPRTALGPYTDAELPTKPIAIPEANGVITFDASLATRSGELSIVQVEGAGALSGWSSPDDTATWHFRTTRSGFYRAELTYATATAASDAELELRIDDRKRLCSLRASGGLDQLITDEYPVAVTVSGLHQLVIQPHGEWNADWLVLQSVRLIPMSADKTRAIP